MSDDLIVRRPQAAPAPLSPSSTQLAEPRPRSGIAAWYDTETPTSIQVVAGLFGFSGVLGTVAVGWGVVKAITRGAPPATWLALGLAAVVVTGLVQTARFLAKGKREGAWWALLALFAQPEWYRGTVGADDAIYAGIILITIALAWRELR